MVDLSCIFFFQAEDGIRDYKVTGVQTCALPIFKGEELHLLHVKLRAKANAAHVVAYCADDRVVTTEKLAGKIPGVHGRLSDRSEERRVGKECRSRGWG